MRALSCIGGSGGNSSTSVDDEREQRKVNKHIEEQLQKDKQLFRATHRLLLLGELCLMTAPLSGFVYSCSVSFSLHDVLQLE
jgi:hypothetical protein